MRQLFALLCHSKVFKSTGLGQPKHVRLTGDSKLGAGVNGAVSLCVSELYSQPVKAIPHFVPVYSWHRLQLHPDPELDKRKKMDGWCRKCQKYQILN